MRIKQQSNAASGLSLLEMLVATTLLIVIVLGLTAMFLQTQKAFRSGTTQTDVMESGRTVIDMMSRDFAQMSDAQSYNITNFFYGWVASGSWTQTNSQGESRQNTLADIFALEHVKDTWYGIGYSVSNSTFGVGTLYRYVYTTNGVPTNNPVDTFLRLNYQTNFYRVVDGVISLTVRAFDASGLELTNSSMNTLTAFWMPDTNPTDRAVVPSLTNNLPNSVEVELALLEPQVAEQVRALPSTNLQQNFLASRLNAVHIFRQQIPVRAALPR